MRQISVKRAKSKQLIPKRHLQICKNIYREEIPRVLDEMEKDASSKEVIRRFFGLLSLYLSCVYGHRTCVLRNMTIAEVDEVRTNASHPMPLRAQRFPSAPTSPIPGRLLRPPRQPLSAPMQQRIPNAPRPWSPWRVLNPPQRSAPRPLYPPKPGHH